MLLEQYFSHLFFKVCFYFLNDNLPGLGCTIHKFQLSLKIQLLANFYRILFKIIILTVNAKNVKIVNENSQFVVHFYSSTCKC
jgi:hypothetical protein